jgi:hypothetical protein
MTTQILVPKQTVPRHDERPTQWDVPDTIAALEAEIPRQVAAPPAWTLWLLSQPSIRLHVEDVDMTDMDTARVAATLNWWHYNITEISSLEVVRADEPPTVDEFIAWLASEDFGDDPERIRREAWH